MKKIYIIIGVVFVAITGTYYLMNNQNQTNDDIYLEENVLEEDVEVESKIKIHITGEVLQAGLYEIDAGARIDDAIRCAGGITENADLNKVNLAYEISDGEKIYIPSIFDEEDEYNISSGMENAGRKININKATAQELQNINGVGPALAEKIVAYREENGKFSTIEDLKNVSGIGDKKFETMKDNIAVK